MAVTATFKADFSSFTEAVNKADVQLKDLDADAGKVGKSLSRMAESLSGKRIIQEAQLMAKAIGDVENVSKLTEAEQRRVNATLTEAIAKYNALGKEAPQALQQLAAKTSGVAVATESWATQAKALAGSLGLVFSAGALLGFARSVVQMGDDIQRTADRTGLLTDQVQRLTYIGGQSGNTLEELTGAVGQMQNRLASGDDSAVAALKQLNLSFDDLAALNPYDQLQKIADGVSQIPNPANQAQIAMDLFGRTGIAILPTLKSQFRELGDEAPVMSDKTVKALDEMGDSLDRLQVSIKVWAAEAYNFFGRVFDQGVALVYNFIGSIFELSAALNGMLLKLPGASKAFPDLVINMKAATAQATWYKEAAALLTTQIEKKAQAATAAIVPIERIGKVQKETAEHTKTYAKAVQEAATVLPEVQHAIDLLAIAHGHEVAALQMEEAAYKATQRAAANYVDHLKTANVVLLEGVRNLSGYAEMVGAAAQSSGNLAHEQEQVTVKSHDLNQALGDLSQAFSQLALVAGDSLGGIARAMGTLVSSIDTAAKGLKSFRDGQAAFKDKDVLAGILGMATGIAGIAAAAIAAGKAIAGLFDRNKGRDLVVDFADTFGGFDQLHAQLLTLGDEGERLWIKLTQGVGRNNPEQAKSVIAEVTAALAKQEAQTGETASATEEQAVATIETASQAQAALDKLGVRLSDNVIEWKQWGADVRAVLQDVANDIYAMPIPGPTGPGFGTVTPSGGGGFVQRRDGSGGEGFSGTVSVPVYLDSEQIGEGLVRMAKRKGLR